MMKRELVCVAFSAMVFAVLAEEDPYADYVKLDSVNWATTSSWDTDRGWSDGLPPHSGTNYFVPAGKRLWRTSTDQTDDDKSTWQGGRLVIGGTLHVAASQNDGYAPQISDLVLLGGSEVRVETYGPLYPRNNVTSEVTVAGTADNPAIISHHYHESSTSGGYVRNHTFYAFFKGTADSVLEYTRPFVNYSGSKADYGFYGTAPNYAFSGYPGTLIVRGGNTVFKSDVGETFNLPLTALKVADGAHCYFYYNENLSEQIANAYLRSLDFSGSTIVLNMRIANSVMKAYPQINVTEGFSAGSGSKVVVNRLDLSMVAGASAENPNGHMMKVAHLSGAAAENPADLSAVKIDGFNSSDLQRFLVLDTFDNEDGSKDVYLTSPGIVTMTNINVETTGHPEGSVQYSAFQEGHSGDWSNLQTPPEDSKLHYWGCKRICFFQDTELPGATLTMAANSSWKAGANIHFKEINLFTGRSFGLWGSNSQRKMKADRFNILRSNDDAGKFATVYVGSSFTYTIDAEITGYGALNLENINDQKCTFVLPHLNTNFHGRLLFSQAPKGSDPMTPFQTQCKISDARNLGGEYTVSDDCYNAIEFLDQPCLFVTDDVTFTEPTRGMYINKGARFDVAAGKRMTLANQVTYGGVLEKTGTGTLDLAGMCRFIDGRPESLPVNGSNELHVAVGSLKISSKTAADGLSVIFAEGTRFVVPANSQAGYFNVKWNNPLVINTDDGKLPVEIEIHEDMGDDDSETTICTFNAQAAENVPVSAFKLGRLSGGLRVKSFAKKTVADGNVAYVATIGRVGTQVILR